MNDVFSPQLFDLGLDLQDLENSTKVDRLISSMESDFDLVMMSDRFDESLVLLKNRLCWPNFNDIAYMRPLTPRDVSKRRAQRAKGKARDNLRRWLWADYRVYDHFSKKFEDLVDDFGSNGMSSATRRLRAANNVLLGRCKYGENGNRFKGLMDCALFQAFKSEKVALLKEHYGVKK